MRLTGKKTVVKALVVRVESLFLPLVLLPGRLPFLLIQVFLRMVHEERVMFVVLHYPLGTVRQQLSQDHVLQVRERELCSWYCTIHSALSDNSSARITSYKRERERERELWSWYCTIHSALSDNSSARITSYKRERERERESYARGTALSTRHCQTTAQPGSRPTRERERVMFVVLHYPLGTVRQ